MYWWNYRKLAEDLRENRVDEKERFKYFLATFIGWNMAVLLWAYSPGPFGLPGFVAVAVCVIIAIIGIASCYRANQRGDNVDFIPRMICLALPVGLQLASVWAMLVLTFGVMESVSAAALGPLSFAYTLPGAAWKSWTDLVAGTAGPIFNMVYFRTIYDLIAFAAKVKDAKNSQYLKQTIWYYENVILGMLSGNVIVSMVLLLAGAWVPSFHDHFFAWESFAFWGVMLWTALFVCVLYRHRRRSVEHA